MLAKQVYHTACRISYRVSDISLKIATNYDIIALNKVLSCPKTNYLIYPLNLQLLLLFRIKASLSEHEVPHLSRR